MIEPFDRATGIGGSDAAAVMGVSPWRDRLDVYLEKSRNPMWRPPRLSPAMRWGNLLEPLVREEYERDTGAVVTTDSSTYWARNKVQYAHLDGIARLPDEPDPGVWEGKTGSTPEAWDDGVPVYYRIQVQQYLAVAELGWADVSVLLPGGDFRTYREEADQGLQQDIERECLALWDHVKRGVPPDPMPPAYAFPVATEEPPIRADEEMQDIAARMLAWAAAEKEAKAEYAALRELLEAKMGAYPVAEGDGWRATWKNPKPTVRTEWDMVASSLADALLAAGGDKALFDTLIGVYSRPGPVTRPFILRSKKESL